MSLNTTWRLCVQHQQITENYCDNTVIRGRHMVSVCVEYTGYGESLANRLELMEMCRNKANISVCGAPDTMEYRCVLGE